MSDETSRHAERIHTDGKEKQTSSDPKFPGELERVRAAAAADIASLQADLIAKNREIGRLKAELAGVLDEDSPDAATVKGLLDLWWREVKDSDKRVKRDLKSTRAPKVRKALKRRGEDMCRRAVLGVRHDDWAMGRVAKSGGKAFNDIAEHILDTDEHVERFAALYDQHANGNGQPARPERLEPIAIEDFLARLENVRQVGQSWMASCPAHDDRHPSFRVGPGTKGIVVHCNGGCTSDQIADALGVPLSRWFYADDTPLRIAKPEPPKPLNMDRQVGQWRDRLQASPAVLARVHELRGWTPSRLKALGVGFDGQRLTIPIHDKNGQLTNVLHYLPARKGDERKLVSMPGRPRDLFPAPESLSGDEWWLFEGECLRGSAEVLTDSGWVRFDALTGSERVAQYEEDGSLRMVHPQAFLRKPYSGQLLRHRNAKRFTITTTPEHKHVAHDYKGRLVKFRADQPRNHYRMPRAGVLDGTGVALTDAQLRLCIAVSADAAIRESSSGSRYAVFCIGKVRKLQRLADLLDACGVPYKSTPVKDGAQLQITCHLPEWVPGRLMPHDWLTRLTADQRRLLVAELTEWDGNEVPNRTMTEYSSKYRENADWVQALAHTIGFRSTVHKHRANAHGSWWKVSILRTAAHVSYQSIDVDRIQHDGEVYCVTVPSGMILVRDDGCVTVTGNSDAVTGRELGLQATGLPGVNGWRVEWARRFADRHVIVCLDCDEQGRKAAQRVLPSLLEHAAEVRVVDLAPDRSDGFDVGDFVREGGSAQDLLRLALAAGAVVRLGEVAA